MPLLIVDGREYRLPACELQAWRDPGSPLAWAAAGHSKIGCSLVWAKTSAQAIEKAVQELQRFHPNETEEVL